MSETTNSNAVIARRANDQARADFATWQMMAKLRSEDCLPQVAQDYLANYRKLSKSNAASEAEATETVIYQIYSSYYARLGGTGSPPEVKSVKRFESMTPDRNDNVTPFRKIKREEPQRASSQPQAERRLPVAAIFIGMIIIAVGWHFLSRGAL